jgi:hypothetical protein
MAADQRRQAQQRDNAQSHLPSATTRLRNRRLQQDEISTRRSCVESNDRMPPGVERETFRLAIHSLRRKTIS